MAPDDSPTHDSSAPASPASESNAPVASDSDSPAPTIGPGDPESFWTPGAIPSATVILVRAQRPGMIETLMLKRDAGLAFAGGMWVFPGGRIDPEDLPRSDSDPMNTSGGSLEAGARVTAVRETKEEAGLIVDPSRLRRWSHWTAPPESPRRFTTAFYIGIVDTDGDQVVIDDREIREFRWMPPSDVIERHAAGELGLTPPTYITLTQLTGLDPTTELSDSVSRRSIEHFATRFGFVAETMIAMYHGDAGYESNDVTAAGQRHRLTMDNPWIYERDPY